VDKIDAVVSGQFELIVSGDRTVLGPGDWVAVPRGVQHTATVVGNEPVVSLDAVKNR
jgi:quercetin dioxygenase-like cupin family protein